MSSRTSLTRPLALVVAFVCLALGIAACAAFGDIEASAPATPEVTTTEPTTSIVPETTTTTTAPTTTVPPTTAPIEVDPAVAEAPVPTDPHLGLIGLGYRPTQADAGRVVAQFQRDVGLDPTGEIDFWTHVAIDEKRTPPLLVPDGEPTRIEVDLAAQRMVVLVDGKVALVSYVSSGSRSTPTLRGDFRVYAHNQGFLPVQKGRTKVYEPLWYSGNYGIHGYHSVPARAASSGCVRIPNWIADDLTALVGVGTPVHIR